MQASMFNLRVPLPERDEVFLMNTLTDVQLIVSSDVDALLSRFGESAGFEASSTEEREAIEFLSESGFLVEARQSE